MEKVSLRLTVFFEEPFWVGVFERVTGGQITVCRVTFGAEPRDLEVWEYVLKHYHELKFSPAVESGTRRKADSPKRRRREAGRQVRGTGVGTRSQQALQLQREQAKTGRRQAGRERRDAERQRRFEMKQQKRKQKHRGH